jgi:DNA helicase-2/ATP-dependent DNA helicase PcrA
MSTRAKYKQDLNHSQLEAVLYKDSPLLVLAGAGSGKTRVITYKIVYLIDEIGIDPHNILAVTFTNKASNEMKERVELLLGNVTDVWVKTFHSTAAAILRTMSDQFDVNPRFTIIDQQDQFSILRKIIKDLNLDPDTYKSSKYAYLIDRAKDGLLTSEESQLEHFSTDPVFYDIYRIYEEKLNNENLLDFGDLIFKLARGLDHNKRALDLLKKRFRYVLVDEFQDTNHAQYVLLKRLTLPEGNICVVGDEDQSIYGFRGARIENILSFSKDYTLTRIIKLEENYRSYQSILTASSHLISNNTGRFGKTLYTNKGRGEKIKFFRAWSDRSEALHIADEIKNLVYGSEYQYSDIAVFYRMNAQSRVFESIFSQMHIPFVVVGGPRFYEREEIKDIIAYIKLALNPMDEISLSRIANKPPRGIGTKTVEALIESTIEKGYPLFRLDEQNKIPRARIRLVKAFTGFCSELHEMALTTYPPQLLRLLFDKSGYLEWLKDENKEEKIKNLEELYNAVEEFSKENPSSPISDFIEEVSLNQVGGEEEYPAGRVYLITLHNAKGLEFPVVFIAGMEDGIFPHYLSGENSADLQEERRLCYVGMTRAMEKLYLSAAKVRKLYGKSVQRGLSKFALELPAELVDFDEERGTALDEVGGGIIFRKYQDRPFQFGKSEKKKIIEREIPDLEINDTVIHEQFGRGKVLEIERGIASIRFEDGKRMKFLLKYTPLKKE